MLRCASVRRSQPDFLVGAAGASDAFSRVHSAGRPSRAQLPRLTSRQPPILWLLLATALSLNPVFSASAPAALATARPLSRQDTLSATRRSGRLRRLADHQSFHRNHCLVPSQLPLPLLSPGLKHSLLLKHSLSRPPYAPPPPCATPKIGATTTRCRPRPRRPGLPWTLYILSSRTQLSAAFPLLHLCFCSRRRTFRLRRHGAALRHVGVLATTIGSLSLAPDAIDPVLPQSSARLLPSPPPSLPWARVAAKVKT